jgi:hypothetical protein
VGCEGALGRFSQKTQRGEVAASLVGPPGVVAMEPAIAAGLHDPFTKERTQPFLPRDHIRKMLTAMEYYSFSITKSFYFYLITLNIASLHDSRIRHPRSPS